MQMNLLEITGKCADGGPGEKGKRCCGESERVRQTEEERRHKKGQIYLCLGE